MSDWAALMIIVVLAIAVRSMIFWLGWNIGLCGMWDTLPHMYMYQAAVLALAVPSFGGYARAITNSK